MPGVRLVVPALVLAGGLGLTACGSGGGADDTAAPATSAPTTTAPTATAPASPGPSGSARAVPERLAFTGTTLDGAAFDAASLAGKPVVLWFWAPWCPKCRAAGPSVAMTAARYRDRVSVVGVAGLSGDTGSMRDFVADTKTADMVNLADGGGDVWKRFGVTAQHTYVLIDADGAVTYTGAIGTSQLDQRVAALAG